MDYRQLYEKTRQVQENSSDIMDFFDDNMFRKWDQHLVDVATDEFKKKYPGKEKDIDDIVDLAGDISNLYSDKNETAEDNPEWKILNKELNDKLSDLVVRINKLTKN